MAALEVSVEEHPSVLTGKADLQTDSSHQREKTSLLYDDCYASLKDHFCMTGRGRRPSLPAVTPTNRILAQLSLLKDAESRTWEEATCWFQKLFPALESVTRGKLEYRTVLVMEKIHSLDGQPLERFLSTKFDLENESPLLSKLGLTRNVLLAKTTENVPCEFDCLTNNFVLELDKFRAKERQYSNFTTKWVVALLLKQGKIVPESRVRHRISQISKQYKKMKLQRGQEEALNQFLNEPVLPSLTQLADKSDISTPSKTKADPLQKVIKKYEHDLNSANSSCEQLQLENVCIKEERDALRIQISSQPQQCNKSIQVDDKRVTKIANLEKDLLKQIQINDILMKENDALKRISEQNKNEIASLKRQLKTEQTLKSKYKKQNEETLMISQAILESEDASPDRKSVVKLKVENKSKNAFTDDVRLTYMALQGEGNVAASNCSNVINIVSKYLYKNEIPMESLPCTQTVLNMSSEGHYLSKKQTAESIVENAHFTFATDGTSREKRHFIERHIVLSNGKVMSLGFTEVVSDNADTLLEKTVELFKELSEVYSEDVEEREKVFKEILCRMKCIMSDRAAVMKLFDRKLEEFKKQTIGEDVSTHFLFCNAHFLLGLSSAAEDACKEIEKEVKDMGVVFGREADIDLSRKLGSFNETVPIRVIRAAADIFGPRGDEKSGCRNQWLVFLDSIGVRSKFTSYRANRFNCLFQNAFALCFHRDHVIKFLEDHVSHSNMKTQSVLADVKDDKVMAMVTALSHFNYCLTAPYWQLMNSTKAYGEFPAYAKKMETFLIQGSSVDSVPMVPCFPDFINKDIFQNTMAVNEKDNLMYTQMFQRMCAKCLIVLQRQLSDFLVGGIFGGEIVEEVKEILMTAPLTNLTGERLFGDFDFDIFKRRRASTFSRSSLNMFKHNKTGRWITKKTPTVAARLLKEARLHGMKMQRKSREAEKDIRLKIRAKLEENLRLKNEKDVATKEKMLQMIDDIINEGGLCYTKEDVDKIMEDRKCLERLKAQIRYRKFVMNEKHLNVTGNATQLYRSLLSSLGYDSENTNPPPKKRARKQ